MDGNAAGRQKRPLLRQSSRAAREHEAQGSSSLGSREQYGETAMELLYLAHEGDVTEMGSLLAKGVDVNFADFDDRTALHVAACEGNLDMVKFLIHKGANVNARDRWGSTPLADAIHYQNNDVCKLLTEHGAYADEMHGVSMHAKNSSNVPDCEVNPAELIFSNKAFAKKGYRIATWRGIQVFVKCFKHNLISEKNLMAFRCELSLIQKLRHPNIVQFLGAVTQSSPWMIIFEYLPQGDLYDFLEKKGSLKPIKAIDFGLDIARGLNYMHEHKPEAIIHRDLKPKNILRDEMGHLKVADLGLSKVLKFSSQTIAEDVQLTLKGRYLAPEVFKNSAYGIKVDVFAFGLILQEMIEGVPPMKEMEKEKVPSAYAANMRPPFKASLRNYPGDLKKLIEECWDEEPARRPTFAHIIDRLENIKYKYSRNPLWKMASLFLH